MKIDGQNEIAAPPARVWDALNDADVLRQCIPGCESLEKVSDTAFKATVVTKVGPVKAKFNGEVTLSDLDPPTSYTLSGRGSGGAAGNARGSAHVTLESQGEGTLLKYDIDAEVTGKLAQLGSRLILSTTKMMAGKFFDKFEAVVGGGTREDYSDSAAEELVAELDGPDPIAPTTSPSTAPVIPPWVWFACGAAILAALGLLILGG